MDEDSLDLSRGPGQGVRSHKPCKWCDWYVVARRTSGPQSVAIALRKCTSFEGGKETACLKKCRSRSSWLKQQQQPAVIGI